MTEKMAANFDRLKTARRQPMRLTAQALVSCAPLREGCDLPVVMRPAVEGVNLVSWAEGNRQSIESELLRYGAVLFRDFTVNSVPHFEQFARALCPALLDYSERAAPRREVGKNVYTSTEFPADQYIPLHHEMSYSHNWPMKLWFYCAQPAQEGGATPIVSDRKVFGLIDPKIKEQFMRKQVMYVRNYGEGVDLTWQEVFQTDDRAAVEQYCRRVGMSFEWRDGDRLRTRAVRQVVATHPQTGETVWFNHAHMFHVSNLTSAVREALLAEFRDDELPRNAFYGDGSPIETSVLEEIREVYRSSAVTFRWQKGDILLLDNLLCSHGREPFVGPRQIMVAMGEMYSAVSS